MKYLSFNTLSGRLIWLVIATLLITQLLFSWLYISKFSSQEQEEQQSLALDKISALLSELDDLDSVNKSVDWQENLLLKYSDESLIFSIDDRIWNNSKELTPSWQTFKKQLIQKTNRDIRLNLGNELLSTSYSEAQIIEDHGEEFNELLIISIPLESGEWLHASTLNIEETTLSDLLFEISLMFASGLIMIPVIIFAVNSITSPLAKLSTAAEKFGKGASIGKAENLKILPLQGTTEIKTATEAFNKMSTRLKRYVADRDQMLAAISHDLRSPLTGMRIQAEFIEDNDVQTSIIEGIEEMETMTQSVLNLLRDESIQENSETISIKLFVSNMIKTYQNNNQLVNWDADTREGMDNFMVSVSPIAFKRALRNIIDNALRYGSEALISLRFHDGLAYIDIKDKGPGIDEKLHEHIFQPFTRLDESRSKEGGGIGLGLSVARSTIRGFGGDITIRNTPLQKSANKDEEKNVGSKFIISLPIEIE